MNAGEDAAEGAGRMRLDKWLWFARVLKSRTLAATAVAEGRVRINKVKVTKPAQAVKPGDVLTIALREKVLVLRLLAPGQRRGPPPEARQLYEDMTPPPLPRPEMSASPWSCSSRGSPDSRRA